MKVQVNGHDRSFDDGLTLAALLELETSSTRGSAAAVDGSVVPRADWAGFELQDGQSVEILTAVQGG